eukprot:13900920-Alexandrium_andersonii.AAC.2
MKKRLCAFQARAPATASAGLPAWPTNGRAPAAWQGNRGEPPLAWAEMRTPGAGAGKVPGALAPGWGTARCSLATRQRAGVPEGPPGGDERLG